MNPQKQPQPTRNLRPLSHGEDKVLLTLTTDQGVPWLINRKVHRLLQNVWLISRAWLVGPYLLMPDQLHLLCAQSVPSCDIETWIQYWQRNFAQLHQEKSWRFHSTSHYDRLQNAETRDHQWAQVRQNPIRAGLTTTADNWPYQGVIFDI